MAQQCTSYNKQITNFAMNHIYVSTIVTTKTILHRKIQHRQFNENYDFASFEKKYIFIYKY